MILEDIINHCRNREFMSGIDRDQSRISNTAEVFTPLSLVNDMLDKLPPEVFVDETKTFLDNSCGDGQFLSEVLIRKVSNGIDFEQALSTIFGVELMLDNVILCRDRLLCGQEHLRHIVEKNIVCADALKYDYSFGGEPLISESELDNIINPEKKAEEAKKKARAEQKAEREAKKKEIAEQKAKEAEAKKKARDEQKAEREAKKKEIAEQKAKARAEKIAEREAKKKEMAEKKAEKEAKKKEIAEQKAKASAEKKLQKNNN